MVISFDFPLWFIVLVNLVISLFCSCVCVDVRDVKGEGDKGGGGALEISVTISSRKFVPSGQ